MLPEGQRGVQSSVADGDTSIHQNQPLQIAQSQWKKLLSGRTSDTEAFNIRPTILTTANLRENHAWGDIIGPKEASVTRLYSINLNGIHLDNKGGSYDAICKTLKELQVDVFCVQEHNVDSTQLRVRSILYDTVNRHWQRNRLVIGTTPITFESIYKPGGTLQMSVGSITGRVFKSERDKWGRWTLQVFSGRGNRKVAILSAYQPVDRSNSSGLITVAAQHQSLLIAARDDTTNPRTAFRRDLLLTLQNLQREGTLILLMGDFNETLGSDPDGITKIASTLKLVDIMRTRHSSTPPSTYARGSKRLDYILASSELIASVRATGYEEFNARIPSDHRGYYIDFDTNGLFGSPTQDLATMTKRGLSSSNVYQVTEYIRQKHRILTANNVFEKAKRLLLPGNRHALAETIDRIVTQASLDAENKVKRVGEAAWSLELAKARTDVVLLTKYLSFVRHGHPGARALAREWLSLHPLDPLPTTVQAVSTKLRDVKENVKTIVANSYQHRNDERQRRIQQLEASRDKADKRRASILRNLKKAEDLKQLFSKLKTVRSTQDKRGVTRVEVPADPGVDPKKCTLWKQIDVPSEVLRLLQERNRTHFGQANGTPFTEPPLYQDLGFCGDSDWSEAILNGTYAPPDMALNTRLLLQHLSYTHDKVRESRATISKDEYVGKLRIWSESTTTSPSGIHLGHYRALIARHQFSSDAGDDQLTDEFKQGRAELNYKQDELLHLHVTMLNYALTRGYSYNRWQVIANTILFKDADNVRLDRTRVIHIYEADYNMSLGVHWRKAMHYAEDNNLLNEGQYGSRPHRTATDPVFCEEMQLEISRATRKPIVLVNYDAKACYDRIIPCLAMLVSRKYGVPKSVTQSNARTLEQAKYRIRTELGLSEDGYSHSDEHPIFGTGQGSSNSPAIWCFLSCALFDAYEQIAHPTRYQSPSRQVHTDLGLLGFVDDCNGQCNAFVEETTDSTIQEVLRRTKDNAQVWTNLLHTSGGALELSKCSCQVVHWMFTPQGAPFLAPKNKQHQDILQVQDPETTKLQTLEVLSPYQAHKTLGHYKDPAGTQREQFRRLQRKCLDITGFLWTCPLTRIEAWTFYHACFLPSITYPLANSSLTKGQLDQVQKKAMTIIVPRCGFNRHTAREVLYGPLELGGANFRHLYIEQGVGQVQMFMRHWRSKSVAGRLLRIAVNWFQHQVGTSVSFLRNVGSPLPHLESKWLASLRSFLASIQSHLILDDPGIPPLQRVHDGLIMDIILRRGQFTDKEVCQLNYCRLFLRAQTLADLTQVNGIYLDQTKLNGLVSIQSSTYEDPQIHQTRPDDSVWQLWKRANRLWSDDDGKLFQKLGPWQLPIHQQRQRHLAYHSVDFLWVKMDGLYVQCKPTEAVGKYEETLTTRPWIELPKKAIPVHARLVTSNVWKLDHRGACLYTPPRILSATFTDYLLNQPQWECELLEHLDLKDDAHTTAWKLSFGVRGVSDGSVWLKSLGAFGWALATDEGERVAECMGPAAGSSPNSYRSEAYGLLSLIVFLRRLHDFTGQHEPWEGQLASDNQALVDAIHGKFPEDAADLNVNFMLYKPRLSELSPEWDLVYSIRQELTNMPMVRILHVKGHQDRHIQYRNLSLLSQLNVDADRKANQYQRTLGAPRPLATLNAWAGVHLVTPKGTVTSRYASTIRHQATAPSLRAYVKLKYHWSSATMEAINWEAHGASLRRNVQHRSHYIKLVHNILPTNSRVHRQTPQRQKCPLCACLKEDWIHILRCSHPTRKQWRSDFIHALRNACQHRDTRPELESILTDGLTGWLTHDDVDSRFWLPSAIYSDKYAILIHSQNEIGWDQLFLGRFAWGWSNRQDDHISLQRFPETTRRTGQKWQIQLISFIWERWYGLWTLRNADVHGNDQVSQARLERTATLHTLRELYCLKAHVEPSVQPLFMSDITAHEIKPTWHLKNWLATNEALIRASHRHVKKKSLQGMRSIRSYFQGV